MPYLETKTDLAPTIPSTAEWVDVNIDALDDASVTAILEYNIKITPTASQEDNKVLVRASASGHIYTLISFGSTDPADSAGFAGQGFCPISHTYEEVVTPGAGPEGEDLVEQVLHKDFQYLIIGDGITSLDLLVAGTVVATSTEEDVE